MERAGSHHPPVLDRATEEIGDEVELHYSQPSIQADWLIESTVDGSTWLRRFSSFEADHNHQAKVRNSWLKAFQDLGFSPRFVSSEQIESGELRTKPAVVVLPSSFTTPGGRLLGFERNITYQMSEELKQAGGNEPLEKSVEVQASLSQTGHVYDLRSGGYLGEVNRIRFTLNPWRPSLFAITPDRLRSGSAVDELLKAVVPN